MAVIGDSGTHTIHFGIFEVDLRAGELRRNGSKVRLQEQPFQILTLLLEHSGEVVTREELRNELWPADTFVDFDHSLNAAIRRLRDALGDSAENPRFVETVARRGYRFLMPVNGAQSGAQTAVPPVPISPSVLNQPISKKWQIVVAVLLIVVTAGWVVSRRWIRPIQFKQRRLTANPEDDPVAGAVISPDGKYLAFSDNTGFYLREIDSGETHPLSAPKAISPVPAAWYPDGTHLIAKGVEGPKAPPSLWQISIVGGDARKLVDDARSPAVSPDGSQILFVRGPATNQEIWVVQANMEKPTRLVPAGSSMFITPAWSPDGKKIVYVTGKYELKHWQTSLRIEVFDLATSHKEAILPPMDFRPGLVWTPDNRLIYALAEPPPNQSDSNLWSVRLNRDGHIFQPASRLTATSGDVAAMSATVDGKRIAYTKHSLQPDVYIAELNGARNRLSTPKRLTRDERLDFPFAWTPDSKAVFFVSDRDGAFHIYKQAIDQTVPERLARGDTQAMAPRLTPDGSSVLYVIWPKLGESPDAGGLMRMPLAGGPPRVLVTQAAIGNVECTRLPSTFCMYDVRAENQLSFFRVDPTTGKSEELPQLKIQGDDPSYTYNWSLSPDGKILATAEREGWAMGDYSGQRSPSITFISVAGGSKHTVSVSAWAGINSIDWDIDGRSLWAPVYTTTGRWALLKINLQGPATTMLVDSRMTIGWAIPAPDGKHVALWKASGPSNVWMLEQF